MQLLYTGMIIGLMYLYFNAIRTGQLDMMLLSQIPYGAQMQMVATGLLHIHRSNSIIFYRSTIETASPNGQRTGSHQRDFTRFTASRNPECIQAKQDATIGWMGQQFIQTEYPQSFFETTLPKVFDTIFSSTSPDPLSDQPTQCCPRE